MPGMITGLNVDDPAVVAAFRSALLHQGLIALAIFAVLTAAWAALRAWGPPRAAAGPPAGPEPAGRLLLVIGFGNLWLFDGFLQAQPGMAIGLPSQVIEPVAAGSPAWVQHVVNWAGTTWSYHPMQAAAAAVWIQVGLGVWILTAPRGPVSRLAGLVSVGWGLIVWVFGEAFGGLLAPGLSWLSGAPGAAALYVVAGTLLALPERAWRSPRPGRLVLAGLGTFLIGMAVLQAWPGRGSWSGQVHGQPGPLAGMSLSMSVSPQPGFLSGWLAAFGTFDQAHGAAVNLVVVAGLALAGAAFLSGRRAVIRPALAGFAVLCLAAWVLAQDLGFLGGLGTDPNSMIPFILLAGAGYLALTRAAPDPAGASALTRPKLTQPEPARPEPARPGLTRPAPARSWLSRPGRLAAGASGRSLAAAGGAALILLGAAPLAAAQASRDADPILAQSIAGGSAADYPAPGFALTGPDGRPVTLASLRGAVVLLAFVDPGCRAGCPPLGPQFRMLRQLLGPGRGRVELIGIGTDPARGTAAAWPAFSRRQGLTGVPGWRYLTGTTAQLGRAWRAYGAGRAGTVFVIDPAGRVRQVFRRDPGPGTAATRSSFAALFAGAVRQSLAAR